MVRQWQELFFAERYSEIDLSDNPDFAALAQVFGIPARRIELRNQVDDALAELLAQPGPALLHVAIDIKANVWPLVPPNHANSSMLDGNPAKQSPEPSSHAIPA
jgi:acetolactate synthase-1/2/3 large subunit